MPRAENPAQHPVGAGIRPDQTDAVSDLIRDEPIAAYENLKRYLTEEDKADIATLIRLRAEINQGKQ